MGPSWKTLPTSAPPTAKQTNNALLVSTRLVGSSERERQREKEHRRLIVRTFKAFSMGRESNAIFATKCSALDELLFVEKPASRIAWCKQTTPHNRGQVHMRHPALHPSLTRATDSSVPDTSSATIVAKSRRDASGRNFDWVGGWTIECEQEWKRGQRRAYAPCVLVQSPTCKCGMASPS